ncbi:MAG: hypothetical protein U0271_44640 [Polyangiaceae bacterium]
MGVGARRPLAAFVLVVGGGFVAGSCRDIVAPDVVDLSAKLCEMSVNCDGLDWNCPDELDLRFHSDLTDEFLAHVKVKDCFTSCSAVRECRDQPPICADYGRTCGPNQGCCNETLGIATCYQDRCCVPDGAPCGSGHPCCSGVACDQDGRCGDIVCKDVGDTCLSNFDCCSRRCDEGGECVANLCTKPGEFCATASDCCPPIDGGDLYDCLPSSEDPAIKVCRRPEEECFCDPFDPENCCIPQGKVCFPTGDGLSACAAPTCPPAGAECGGDIDCRCLDGSAPDLLCDDAFIPHCAECRGPGSHCITSDECCLGECDASHHCAL